MKQSNCQIKVPQDGYPDLEFWKLLSASSHVFGCSFFVMAHHIIGIWFDMGSTIKLALSHNIVTRCDPHHISLLQRGTKKLIEYKIFIQALPYFERLIYMYRRYMIFLAVEKVLNSEVPLWIKYIRTILNSYSSIYTWFLWKKLIPLFVEVTRILNHIMVACMNEIKADYAKVASMSRAEMNIPMEASFIHHFNLFVGQSFHQVSPEIACEAIQGLKRHIRSLVL
uniref:Uncharacterized protein n=1 Tax=Glossina brevipalpis TaxID=37001 RepID=A0A1A9WYC3_9MUSC